MQNWEASWEPALSRPQETCGSALWPPQQWRYWQIPRELIRTAKPPSHHRIGSSKPAREVSPCLQIKKLRNSTVSLLHTNFQVGNFPRCKHAFACPLMPRMSETAAYPPSPTADDPSVLPPSTSLPPPVSNSSCLLTQCQILYYTLLYFSKYVTYKIKNVLFLFMFYALFVWKVL